MNRVLVMHQLNGLVVLAQESELGGRFVRVPFRCPDCLGDRPEPRTTPAGLIGILYAHDQTCPLLLGLQHRQGGRS